MVREIRFPQIIVACVFCCISLAAIADDARSIADRDTAVLTVVLSHFSSRRDTWPANPKGYTAIEPQTKTVATQIRTSDFLEQLHDTRRRAPLEAVSDFIRRNQHSNSIPALLASTARVQVLTREQAKGDSIAMLKPDIAHLVTAYNPGYTRDGKTALVRLEFNWSIHSAYATYLVQKREEGWSVAASELTVFP
jgi:hypothetical protein